MPKETEREEMQNSELFSIENIWCVIPVFNNRDTIKEVASGCRSIIKHVIVVDDGSSDCDIKELLSGMDITVLRHKRNLGKGEAIRTALRYIEKTDARFMITVDGDGQHYPEDINKFIPLLQGKEDYIFIGLRDFSGENIPGKSRFGREFSNFWFRLETGFTIEDSQSGFRAYPVKYLSQLKLDGRHYDFEAEVLTRAVWSGLKVKAVPIRVFYPKKEMRVSSFRPFLDNLRIALMHTRLVGRRLLPIPYHRLVAVSVKNDFPDIIRHPLQSLKKLLKEEATPLGLAFSAGVGIFLAVLPLISLHTLAIIYVTTRLHLNKIMALSIQNLCVPPFVPLACMELGHFIIYGRWITDLSWQTVFGSIPDRLWEWFIGSLILAPLLAVITAFIVYLTASILQSKVNYGKG
jgi:glycosyltransferase involved in cell wall biosynthesis